MIQQTFYSLILVLQDLIIVDRRILNIPAYIESFVNILRKLGSEDDVLLANKFRL